MAFLIAMMTGIGFCAAQASSSVEALTSTFVFDNNTLVSDSSSPSLPDSSSSAE